MKQSDIENLAVSVGLPPDRAVVAAAIAMAESGGDPRSHNTNVLTGDNSYGLWQINMIGDMGPARRKQFGIASNDALFDPQTNAHAMAILSNGGVTWTKWTTFTSGRYKQYLSSPAGRVIDGATGAVGAGVDTIGKGIDTVGSQLTSWESAIATGGVALEKGAAWISNAQNWVRIGYVIGGGILIAVVIGKLASGTPVGKAVTKTAKKAAATAAVA